ncbi:MAG TPA: glycosyltransferase family 2 protein [Gemmatimonadales bacterium]|nr:glycosyltransferase family 2 protein [Gemmatimonadales bacterium]
MISVVIGNYNYARYLPDAIESALGQTHDRVEVIVVDDGSTDESRAVIERYRGRVLPVLKENGGQGSTFNAGFRRASGGAVIFLDADDVLHRDTAARVAAAFAARPELAKVHYRLELMDADGRPSGSVVPPAGLELPTGDLRERLRRSPDDVPYPPASGNAFATWALRRVLPMPEEEYRLLADVYLLNLVPLLGPVEALDGVGGRYRVHAGNGHYASSLRLDRVRATVRIIHHTHAHMRRLADSLRLDAYPGAEQDERSLVFLSQRLVSRKLEPHLHPLPGDTVARLGVRGAAAALGRSDLSWGLRLLYPAWFLAMAAAPRRPAGWLAEKMLYPERRGAIGALVERLRGAP